MKKETIITRIKIRTPDAERYQHLVLEYVLNCYPLIRDCNLWMTMSTQQGHLNAPLYTNCTKCLPHSLEKSRTVQNVNAQKFRLSGEAFCGLPIHGG
jgi:hypothetical protein